MSQNKKLTQQEQAAYALALNDYMKWAKLIYRVGIISIAIPIVVFFMMFAAVTASATPVFGFGALFGIPLLIVLPFGDIILALIAIIRMVSFRINFNPPKPDTAMKFYIIGIALSLVTAMLPVILLSFYK